MADNSIEFTMKRGALKFELIDAESHRYVHGYMRLRDNTSVAFACSSVPGRPYGMENWLSVFDDSIVLSDTHFRLEAKHIDVAKAWLEARGYTVHDQRKKEAVA